MEMYKLKSYAIMLRDQLKNWDSNEFVSSSDRLKIKNFFRLAKDTLPSHSTYITEEQSEVDSYYHVGEALSAINHIVEIIDIEQMTPPDIKQALFESSLDKYKKCKLFYEENDFTSLFNNINSSLELLLKESLELPTTSKIPTSNMIDKLVKHKIEPYLFLDVNRKKIIDIDNKVKHSGYIPSKKDAIDAMKSMEDTLNKLHGNKIVLPQNVRDELYEMM